MPNVFIDCGLYDGVAIEMAIDQGQVDKDWQIYSFEPNPTLPVKDVIKRLDVDISLELSAVWISDGVVPFLISNRPNASSVEGTAGNDDTNKINVTSIDFSKFVYNLPPSYIACSMDIEGSEFPVLEKMIKDDTMKLIDYLDVEFHHRLMNDCDGDDARKLIKQIRKAGTQVVLRNRL